jgi:hypothetical protein
MAENINWTLNVQVVGRPKMAASKTVDVDAYDKIQVTVDAGDLDKVVAVQPGAKKGRVTFLLINSDQFGDNGDKLSYKVDNGGPIALGAPQLFIGDGAVGLLAEAPNEVPKSSSSSNELS